MSDNNDYNDENVLKYIYMLNNHLERVKLNFQGLMIITNKNKQQLKRISDPVAPDDFIYTQVGSLRTVLAPHNIITQLKNTEKNEIILDTFYAFCDACLKEPFFNWDFFQSVASSFYNTIHLFLNIAENGFGANFTASVQSGISQKIEANKTPETVKPYINLPDMFGFNKPKDTNLSSEQIQNDSNNNYNEDDRGYD